MKQDMIAVLDLGGQDNVRVARALREKGVYSEIHPHDISPDALKALPGIRGFIVNGGENRVVDGVSIDVDPGVYQVGPSLPGGQPPGQPAQRPWRPGPWIWGRPFRTLSPGAAPQANWSMENFIEDQVALIRQQVGDGKVLLALSGGVDSSVWRRCCCGLSGISSPAST